MSKLQRMAEIAQQMATQDNMGTANPLFIVFEKDRIYRVDEDDADGFRWYTSDDFDDVSHQKRAALERKYQDEGEEPEGYSRVNYKDIDRFVTACLTRKGAQDYIRANGHNLNKPRIYVASAYRNQEMIDVRAYLQSLPTPTTP